MINIKVLGDGITAAAVKTFLLDHKDSYAIVEENYDLVITSPGIPPQKWPAVDCEIISDIEFAYRVLKDRGVTPTIIGVTGTNGKTTITSGIAHGLNVTPYGNIGRPLILDVDGLKSSDTIVIELSSFQLVSSPTLHCNIAVITNIESDHLEWHQTFSNYKKAKLGLLKTKQICYLPQAIINSESLPSNSSVYSIESLPKSDFTQFYGHHNQINAAIINSILLRLGMTQAQIDKQIKTFKLPPFRCEPIHSKNGLTIINDSKATNMAATLAALNSFDGKLLLILSGQPKAVYTKSFMRAVFERCELVYASGELAKNQDWFPVEFQAKINFFETLEKAVKAAIKSFEKGVILFSPSAASFDEFENYNERGALFSEYVKSTI